MVWVERDLLRCLFGMIFSRDVLALFLHHFSHSSQYPTIREYRIEYTRFITLCKFSGTLSNLFAMMAAYRHLHAMNMMLERFLLITLESDSLPKRMNAVKLVGMGIPSLVRRRMIGRQRWRLMAGHSARCFWVSRSIRHD